MPKTRDFIEQLRFAYNKNVSRELLKDIAYMVDKILRDENTAIQHVSAHVFYQPNKRNLELYFVIKETDEHLRLPLFNNPEFTATYLTENARKTASELAEACVWIRETDT